MRMSSKSALVAGVIAVSLAGLANAADGPKLYDGYKPPKDSAGRPDVTGVWSASTMTPLQRLPGFGNRITMTPDEVAKLEGRVAASAALARRGDIAAATAAGVVPGDTCRLDPSGNVTVISDMGIGKMREGLRLGGPPSLAVASFGETNTRSLRDRVFGRHGQTRTADLLRVKQAL